MLRFVLKRTVGIVNVACGQVSSGLETLDAECPELEAMLRRGGFGPDGLDQTELLGVAAVLKVEERPKAEQPVAADGEGGT